MDTGRGEFAQISKEKAVEFDSYKNEKGQSMPYFAEGQTVELKGSKFTIHSIKRNKIILKLLPKRFQEGGDNDKSLD